jgi:tetratricopeptide (TPR) repeat protein
MPQRRQPRERRTAEDFAVAFTDLLLAAGLNPDKLSRELARQNHRGLVRRSTLYDWKKGQHLPEDDDVFLTIVRVCVDCAHLRGTRPPSEDDLLALLGEARLSRDSRSDLTGAKDRHTAVAGRPDAGPARDEQSRAAALKAWIDVGDPLAKGPPAGPAGWLRPDRAVVEFTGRETELAQLRAWCKPEGTGQVRVLIGAGGVGKTRLALQVAAEWEARGTEWRLVAAGEEAGAVAAARGVTSGPVLLIIDYAETRGGLPKLLRAVFGDPGIIRVLLVARSLGEWWEQLVEESPEAIGQMLSAAPPIRLGAPVTTDFSDAELVTAAVPYFCRVLEVEQTGQIEFELPAARVPILVLHTAALVAVLRFQSGPAASPPMVVGPGVLDVLLIHEARYWRRTARAAGLPARGPLVKPVVAAAVLIGAGSLTETAKMVTRVPALAEISVEQQDLWARWLYDLYPAGIDGKLGSLQPDLLAETHVVRQLASAPDLARSCLRDLTKEQAEHALTVLARAWAHHDDTQRLITEALSAAPEELAVPAITVAVETNPALGSLLQRALTSTMPAPAVLESIGDALPFPSLALAETAATVNRRLVDLAEGDPPRRANHLIGLSNSLGALGRRDEALAAIEEAVTIYRQLAADQPDVFRPGLARSLNVQATQLAYLASRGEALAAIEEAVAIYRELAAARPDLFRPSLARSLNIQSTRLAYLGRHEEAIVVIEEAVTIRRELAAARPDAYRPDLAASLNNQSLRLADLGRQDEALAVIEEAITIRRELAAARPDAFLLVLAASLNNQSNYLAYLGRREEALAAMEEAVTIRRERAALPSWAASLNNLSRQLADLGRREEALGAIEEAITIRRELAAERPVAFRPDLASSLNNLSHQLTDLGRQEEALAVIEEAITIRRELAAERPAVFRPRLASSLNVLADALSALGRERDAAAARAEAKALNRRP